MNAPCTNTEKLIRVRLARAIREYVEMVGVKRAHRDFCDLAEAVWLHSTGEKLDLTMILENRR